MSIEERAPNEAPLAQPGSGAMLEELRAIRRALEGMLQIMAERQAESESDDDELLEEAVIVAATPEEEPEIQAEVGAAEPSRPEKDAKKRKGRKGRKG